jgi:hypothetical protein
MKVTMATGPVNPIPCLGFANISKSLFWGAPGRFLTIEFGIYLISTSNFNPIVPVKS